MNLDLFLKTNNINQIYISKSLYDNKNNSNITSLYENTLVFGIYYKEDLSICKNLKGKIWILWDLNDCNSNYKGRVNYVNIIKKLKIEMHLCFRNKTAYYLEWFNIKYKMLPLNTYNLAVSYLQTQIDKKYTNLIIGIVSCKKNLDRQNIIRNTWVKKLGKIKYYFIIGHDKETKIIGDVIYVNSGDYYENLPSKISSFIRYIYEKTDYKYLFKVDDDCYININRLSSFDFTHYNYLGLKIGATKDNYNNKWHFNKCKSELLNSLVNTKPFLCDWCGGGFGYFLSRKSMEAISLNTSYLEDELYEDKGIGEILFINNIKIDTDKSYKVSKKLKKDVFLYYDLSIKEISNFHKCLS